jgi:transcription antitermination factor NusG
MALAIHSQSLLNANELLSCRSEFRWYAAQVRANHDKRVGEQLAERSVEFFLPLYESVRHWKDRRVKLHLPLFPGYVLVRIELGERLQVLQVPGVARLVGFNGQPAPLEDAEIETLRRKLNGPVRAEPHPFLQIGRRVRVKKGPLEGFEGFLVRQKQKYRIVLSIDTIMRSIAAEVDLADVEFVSPGPRIPVQVLTNRRRFASPNFQDRSYK